MTYYEVATNAHGRVDLCTAGWNHAGAVGCFRCHHEKAGGAVLINRFIDRFIKITHFIDRLFSPHCPDTTYKQESK